MQPLLSDKKFPFVRPSTMKPPDPKIFFITPKNSDEFDLSFMAEFIIVALEFLLAIIYAKITRRTRLNDVIKYLSYFYIIHFVLFLLARTAIILIQGYYLVHQDVRPPSLGIVIFCSFVQGYYLILVLTSVFWIGLERLHARWCIRDYEADPDYRVSVNIFTFAVCFGLYGSALCTSGYVPWSTVAAIGAGSMFLGAVIIFICYRNTLTYYGKILKRTDFNARKLRSEAEANIWNTKLLIHVSIINTVLNCVTLGGFAAVFLPEYEEEQRQLYYCFLTIFLHLNSPITAGLLLYTNSYLRSVAKLLLFPPECTYEREEPTRIFALEERRQSTTIAVKPRRIAPI